MSNRLFTAVFALVALFSLFLFVGCGNGNNPGNSAQATRGALVQLNIAWPEKTRNPGTGRYIPSYASSLFLELYLTADPTRRFTLVANRPSDKPSTQTVSFTGLINEGAYTLAGAARVLPDGAGATVASSASSVAVKVGMSPVELSLVSTIKTISILGQPLTATVGTAVTLQGGAFDPDGRTLLLPTGALTWSVVSGGAFGTLTPAGVLTPTAAGTLRVRLAEVAAGITSEADILISTLNIVASLGATPYPKENADLFNTGLVTGRGSTGLFAWTYDLGASAGFYSNTPILGANGLVYATSLATGNSNAVGINKADGTKAFQVALNGNTPYSPVVLSTNLVCIPLNNIGLVALDANTGIERWRNLTVNAVAAATVDRSGHLLIASRDGVHVLDANNGNDLGAFSGTNCSLPAVGQDGTVYYVRQVGASSAQGELVAGNPTTRQSIWTATEVEQGHSPVIGPNGQVYVIGSQAGTAFTRIAAFDPATGALKSELRNQFFSFSQDPVFGADGLLYIGQGNKITAFGLDLVQVRQSAAIDLGDSNFLTTRRITIGSDSILYVAADQNNPTTPALLVALNTADLTVKWKYNFTGRALGSIAIDSDGTVYFETDGGKVTALR